VNDVNASTLVHMWIVDYCHASLLNKILHFAALFENVVSLYTAFKITGFTVFYILKIIGGS